MGRPTRKAARMSEWELHCEVKHRHIRRRQPTRDAAPKDARSQLLQGYSVNRIVVPNETVTAERIKSWCASRRFSHESLWRRRVSQAEPLSVQPPRPVMKGSRDPAFGKRVGFSFLGRSDTSSDGTECSARRKARASHPR